MQVLSLGLGRTGTTSKFCPSKFMTKAFAIETIVAMQAALEILGCHNVHHGFTVFDDIEGCKMWAAALDAKYFDRGKPFTRREWEILLGPYDGVCDYPAAAFADELIEAYPEAKVVLVEREIESWYRSFDAEIVPVIFSTLNNVLALLDPQLMGNIMEMWTRAYKGAFRCRSKSEMEKNARQVYKDHYAHVRNITPQDKLLNFRLADGWGPLCKFLGEEEPDCPFPKLNEKGAVAKFERNFQEKCMFHVVRNVSIIVTVLAVGVWWAVSSRHPRTFFKL